MKFFLYPILLPILIGCINSNTKPNQGKSKKIVETRNYDTTKSANTEQPQLNPQSTDVVPKGFSADTLNRIEKLLNLNTSIVYLYLSDTSQIKLKYIVYKTINAKLKEFKKELSKTSKNEQNQLDSEYDLPNIFDAFYDSYYEDNKIVSIRYIISFSYSGGVHPFTEYASINYDKETQRLFSFKDYFNIQTPKDSLLILAPLEKDFGEFSEVLANRNLWDFYNLNDGNFSIQKDSISFNFNDYAIGQGPSMLDCKISKRELKNIIKSNYW